MSIASVSNQNAATLFTQNTQQSQQQSQTAGTSSGWGEAAVLDLSSTSATSSAAAASPASQAASGGGGGGASKTGSCPLGNQTCVGCGQCGKTTTASLARQQTQFGASAADGTNSPMASAISAYDANSVFL